VSALGAVFLAASSIAVLWPGSAWQASGSGGIDR
jgi:hypothetical protein